MADGARPLNKRDKPQPGTKTKQKHQNKYFVNTTSRYLAAGTLHSHTHSLSLFLSSSTPQVVTTTVMTTTLRWHTQADNHQPCLTNYCLPSCPVHSSCSMPIVQYSQPIDQALHSIARSFRSQWGKQQGQRLIAPGITISCL